MLSKLCCDCSRLGGCSWRVCWIPSLPAPSVCSWEMNELLLLPHLDPMLPCPPAFACISLPRFWLVVATGCVYFGKE